MIQSPVEIAKHSKSDLQPKAGVLYLERDGSKYFCSECVFYKEKKCALYGPQVEIKPWGACGLWQKGSGKGTMGWINSTTKEESGYEESPGGFGCKRCDEFITGGRCKKVEGKISPEGCCNLWEEKHDHGED